MPLIHSNSEAAFRQNVAEMIRAGKPRAQALAAAYRNQRQHRDIGGGIGGAMGRPMGMPMQPMRGPGLGSPAVPMMQQPRPMNPTAAVQQSAFRKGGGIAHLAFGGDPMGISPAEGSPWWERSETRQANSGLLSGATPGRADQLLATAPSGAYVLPADVISHLGEGNTLAGAKVWDSILHSNPYGISGTNARGKLPAAHARAPSGVGIEAAKGGGLQGKGIAGQRIPVALSDGEVIVSPEDVRRIGGGNVKKGHSVLDKFVMKVRKDHIDTLKKMKPPVGSKT